jgi:hypothetical protein
METECIDSCREKGDIISIMECTRLGGDLAKIYKNLSQVAMKKMR